MLPGKEIVFILIFSACQSIETIKRESTASSSEPGPSESGSEGENGCGSTRQSPYF